MSKACKKQRSGCCKRLEAMNDDSGDDDDDGDDDSDGVGDGDGDSE